MKRPRVIANFAVTADGKISTRRRTPALFTSPADKHRLLEIRALGDAVLVGHGTAVADKMSLGLPDAKLRAERRARGQAEFPLRVIVSNSGRISSTLRALQTPGGAVHLFVGAKVPPKTPVRLAALGAQVQVAKGPEVDLGQMLLALRREHNVRVVVCEGGAALLRSLVTADLLDELYVTWCATIFGGTAAPTLLGSPADGLPHSIRLRLISLEPGGEGEVFLRYRVTRRKTF